MTNLLLRLFVRGYEDPRQPRVRAAVGKLSGVVGIVCNLALFAMKLAVGTVSGSVAITADALNNLSDATSSIVTLIGFKLAEKPADEHHPYGHARYEYLSGLTVAGMILIIGFELGKTSVEKILAPTPVEFSIPVAVVLVSSIIIKLWLCLFNRRLGRHIGSTALQATATDSRNDAISTAAVLAATLVELLTSWQIDGFMGLGVAAFILCSGISLGKETISPLLGESASAELRELIVSVLEDHPEVLGYHDLMVHDYGPGQRFASMHVEMDQGADPLECHELIDNLERECLKKHRVHLVIHYDPVVTGDAEQDRLRDLVEDILREVDARISVHDFRMVRGKGHTNLIFDAALPPERMKEKKEIKRRLDEALNIREETTYYTVITFDLDAFN